MITLALGHSLGCLQAMSATGGLSESIFPRVERMLLEGDDYQRALEFVAARKNMEGYRSMMDFLFCELHPDWRSDCRRYYAGKGPQLREQISDWHVRRYSARMVAALRIARQAFRERRAQSWAKFRRQVDEQVRLAA